MWETFFWIALAIGGIILGWLIWSNITEDDGFWGSVIGLIIVAVIKFNFTDKVFVCENANINDTYMENTYKSEALGSKMILEFYDDDVKCIFPDNYSVVLKKMMDNSSEEVYSSQELHTKLTIKKVAFFITEVIIETDNGILKYKRKYI